MKIALIILLATGQVLAAPKAAKQELKKVLTEKIKKQIFEKTITYPVTVTSRTYSLVKSPTSGVVTDILVDLGAKIKRGKKLLAVKQYENGYEYRPNFPKAMVNGIVSEIYVNKGQYVNKGEYLLAVTDPNNLFARMNIALKDKNLLKKNQQGTMFVEQLNKKFPIKISGIGSNMNPTTGTFSSELEIEDGKDLINGVVGKATITLDKQEKILIPQTALYYVGGKTKVAKLDAGKVKKIDVKIGPKVGDKVEIVSGLNIDTEIIVRSSGFIADGDKVEVIKDKK
jgi:multidrug efflux pump subunit AcrA (membrane-fusion protein)